MDARVFFVIGAPQTTQNLFRYRLPACPFLMSSGQDSARLYHCLLRSAFLASLLQSGQYLQLGDVMMNSLPQYAHFRFVFADDAGCADFYTFVRFTQGLFPAELLAIRAIHRAMASKELLPANSADSFAFFFRPCLEPFLAAFRAIPRTRRPEKLSTSIKAYHRMLYVLHKIHLRQVLMYDMTGTTRVDIGLCHFLCPLYSAAASAARSFQ